MAIDLIIYTKIDTDILQLELDRIQAKYPNLFSVCETRCYPAYIMYPARFIADEESLLLIEDRSERYHMEARRLIADEFGMMNPKSDFMVSLNDKSFLRLILPKWQISCVKNWVQIILLCYIVVIL